MKKDKITNNGLDEGLQRLLNECDEEEGLEKGKLDEEEGEVDDKINIWRKDKTKRQDKEQYYNNRDRENPYRESSSLDISKTMKSYRWIETELLMELIKSKITSSEWSIFMYILHRTRGYCDHNGFYKHLVGIPIRLFEKSTGLKKSTIYRSIKSLIKKRMIYEVEIDDLKGVYTSLGINWRYDTWIYKNDDEE